MWGRFIMNRGRDCFRNFTKNIGSWNICVQKYPHKYAAATRTHHISSLFSACLRCGASWYNCNTWRQPMGKELDWNIIMMKWPGWNPFEIQGSHWKMLRQHGHPLVVTCCEYAIDFGPMSVGLPQNHGPREFDLQLCSTDPRKVEHQPARRLWAGLDCVWCVRSGGCILLRTCRPDPHQDTMKNMAGFSRQTLLCSDMIRHCRARECKNSNKSMWLKVAEEHV